MRASYSAFLDQLRKRLLGEGRLPINVRQDILEGRIVEGILNGFVVRVRGNATSVTQEHIDELKAGGFDEDQIFEAAVCAAFVAGAERFQAGMKALAEATDAP